MVWAKYPVRSVGDEVIMSNGQLFQCSGIGKFKVMQNKKKVNEQDKVISYHFGLFVYYFYFLPDARQGLIAYTVLSNPSTNLVQDFT